MPRLPRSSLALAALLGLAACADARPADAVRTADARAAAMAAPGAPDDHGFSLYELPSVWRDQRGREVRLPDLAGKVRLVAMVYTSCHASCPLVVADLKRVEASVADARRDDVGFVLVSLDPERDTPGRLTEWAARMQLDPARWTLLNGSDAAVREIAVTLGVRYQPQADGELAHSNVITVLDATGRPVYQQLGLGAATRGTVAVVEHLLRGVPGSGLRVSSAARQDAPRP